MFETTNQILHLRFSGMMIYDDILKKTGHDVIDCGEY